MDKITTGEELLSITGNSFIGTIPEMSNSSIEFNGTGNVLYCEEGVKMRGSRLLFNGDNAVIALGKSRHTYVLRVTVNNNCSALFGRNIYFNQALNAIASEECSIVMGDECLVSFGVWIRTADPHLVYSATSHERINPSKDVVIGDHVWIGQNALILKGSNIGSGSIIGGMAVVSGKRIESNTSWAGNPAKFIAGDLFWERSCVHTWTTENTEKHKTYPSSEFIFSPDKTTISAKDLSARLSGLSGSKERLDYWLSLSYENRSRNRFAISGDAGASGDPGHRSGLFKRRK